MQNLRLTSTFKSTALAVAFCATVLATSFHGSLAHAAESNLPPYEQSLRRLSAIVGALMYLDPLCNNSQPTAWHDQMASILDAENADDARRRQLTDRFNRAYRTYALTYRSCNNQARMATDLYHQEGQDILSVLKLKHAR